MKEIRWHARAGQGAKTASQLYATTSLAAGKSVQAFPEYGPERRGAPLRAFTRVDDRPIRRHDSVTSPDVVVVLEPSLLHEVDVTEGLTRDGLMLVNAERPPAKVAGGRVACVPASRLAKQSGSKYANLIMVGALAAAIGEPPVSYVADAAVDLLGKKVPPDEVRRAVMTGYRCLS
ncbi:MAG: 2-oxoacid:acceptor oxidoreductase family protein [Gaiellaceae bacterium]